MNKLFKPLLKMHLFSNKFIYLSQIRLFSKEINHFEQPLNSAQ